MVQQQIDDTLFIISYEKIKTPFGKRVTIWDKCYM